MKTFTCNCGAAVQRQVMLSWICSFKGRLCVHMDARSIHLPAGWRWRWGAGSEARLLLWPRSSCARWTAGMAWCSVFTLNVEGFYFLQLFLHLMPLPWTHLASLSSSQYLSTTLLPPQGTFIPSYFLSGEVAGRFSQYIELKVGFEACIAKIQGSLILIFPNSFQRILQRVWIWLIKKITNLD